MSAVGAVTLRPSLHNSLTCLRCTPIASANAVCVRPSGCMNSSVRISPTETGLRFVISMVRLASSVAVVVEIDAVGFATAAIPSEDQPTLLVDADRMEAFQIAAQLFEVIARRHSQVPICHRIVEHLDFTEQTALQI